MYDNEEYEEHVFFNHEVAIYKSPTAKTWTMYHNKKMISDAPLFMEKELALDWLKNHVKSIINTHEN